MTINYTDRPAQKSPGPSRLVPVPADATALMNYNIQRVTTRVIYFNYDMTVSPTRLNHIGLGWSRFRNRNFSQAFNQGWTQPDGGKLGLKGLQFDLLPTIRFDTGGYTRYGDSIASDNFFNTFTVLDTATMMRGNHTIKFGGEVQYHQDNYRRYGTGGGDFRFRRNGTGDPQNLARTGDAWASFLLGEVHNASATFRSTEPSGRYYNIGFFVEETWKATPKLTLIFGFRWEIILPHKDPAGRMSYMDMGVPNPDAGGLLGAMVFGGAQGFGTQVLDNRWWNPAPRFGFAYRITDKSVIRGGMGIFNSNYINQGLGIPAFGFSQTANFATGDNGITPAFNWDDGFPQNFQRPPITGLEVANGQSVTTVQPADYTLPYKIQWNLTLEHQFREDFSVSGSYLANAGRHLYENQQFNQIPDPATQLPETVLRAKINTPLALNNGVVEPFDGFAELWGGGATVARALRPFPQFHNVRNYGSTYGNSSYHSFQFKLDKRFRGGLSGTVAYTWSKFLTDAAQFDSFSGRQSAYAREKSYHTNDYPHILTFSYLYEFPFGQGKKLASGVSSGANKLISGWQIAGVHSYTSGQRIGITTNNTLPYFNRGLRPDQISSNVRSNISMSNFDPGAKHQYLNKDAFATPASGMYGSAPRYLEVRGPMYMSESFALLKNTAISERVSHQFRMEINNPLNRVVFGNPVSNLASGNFGLVGFESVEVFRQYYYSGRPRFIRPITKALYRCMELDHAQTIIAVCR